MATFFSLFRKFRFQAQTAAATTQGRADFIPLNADLLARIQGGFDEETDPEEEDVDEGGDDPVIEPVSGEVVDEITGT